jgi:arsenate reductase (thioredoxin)
MNILILSTGNSCRSQMAEGRGRTLATDRHAFRSAGIGAHGKNPRAIAVMREAGVDIGLQESARLTNEILAWAGLVVTVCVHADEHCPVLPGGTRKLHWPLEDTARSGGIGCRC